MWRYSSHLKRPYETPSLTGEIAAASREKVSGLLSKVRGEGRSLLTEVESKQILSLYGIPTVPTELASTEEAAKKIAEKMGFPVVVKLHSLTHDPQVRMWEAFSLI